MLYFLSHYVKLSKRILKINLALFVIGVVMIIIGVFAFDYSSSWTFLYPLPAISGGAWGVAGALCYLLGLQIVGLGLLLLILDCGRAIIKEYGSLAKGLGWDVILGKKSEDDAPPTTVVASTMVVIVNTAALISGTIVIIMNIITVLNPSFTFDPLLAKNLTFAFGHILANSTIYMAVIAVYDEKNHRGTLRHIMVRTGKATDEVMVILITRTDHIPQKKKFLEKLLDRFPNVKSIMHNINPDRTNVIFGKVTKTLWGEDYIYDHIGDLTFAISPRSFYQVNPIQTEVLYEKTLEYANVGKNDLVIDAYCGIGTISLFLAQQAKKVYGVEIVPEAVSDAKKNAKLNHIDNAEFYVGEAEKIMPWWTKQGLRPDVIVVDPPRKGCDESLLEAMIAMEPKRIVYVSCNPATLARDLRILEDGGFETKEAQPIDMFAQTSHVEVVTRLERNCR